MRAAQKVTKGLRAMSDHWILNSERELFIELESAMKGMVRILSRIFLETSVRTSRLVEY